LQITSNPPLPQQPARYRKINQHPQNVRKGGNKGCGGGGGVHFEFGEDEREQHADEAADYYYQGHGNAEYEHDLGGAECRYQTHSEGHCQAQKQRDYQLLPKQFGPVPKLYIAHREGSNHQRS